MLSNQVNDGKKEEEEEHNHKIGRFGIYKLIGRTKIVI